jgi:UDP-N-acetylmuramate--alanine ligase
MSLAQGIRQVSSVAVEFFTDFEQTAKALPTLLRAGDLLLTMGAGSVWKVGQEFLNRKG